MNKKVKVCLCLECMDINGGGPSRSVPSLAKSLAQNDIDVTLLTRYSDTNNLHLLENTDVRVVQINSNNEIAEVLTSGFDIIHTQGLWMPFYHVVTKVAKKIGIPLIVTPRGTLEPHCLEDKKIKKKMALVFYQRKDLKEAICLQATAEMEAGSFRKLELKNPIAVIPNGIEISDYPLRSNEEIEKQVLFLSRIDPKKGISILLEAWKDIAPIFLDWKLTIVGNGDEGYIKSLKKEIQRKGIEQSTQILPPAFGEEKYRLYTKSALFVLPTYSENFGMAIAEAMSCGLPIITTTGTPWKMLNSSGAGWCIDLSAENLKNTLIEAMSLPLTELLKKGIIGNKIINKYFTNDGVAVKIAALYSWIIGRSKLVPEFVKLLD